MYGMEKQPQEKFAFDLEKEILEKPARGKQILEVVEKRINGIKKRLREGASEKEFDQLGILLHGYTALQKVLKKIRK